MITIRRIAALLLVVLAAAFACAPAAAAQSTSDAAERAAEARYDRCRESEYTDVDSLLPIDRWAGGATTSLHTRLGASVTDDVTQKLTRQWGTGVILSVGDAMWQTSSALVGISADFNILCSAGVRVDNVVADTSSVLLGSPLVAALVACSIVTILWRTARRGDSVRENLKQLTQIVAILVAAAVMINGASLSSESAGPGRLSPTWIAMKINDSLGAAGEATVQSLTDSINESRTETRSDNPTDDMSCVAYVDELHKRFEQAGGNPLLGTMSSMWEQSALPVWTSIQFGNNRYGEAVYCRLLENHAGVAVKIAEAGDMADPAKQPAKYNRIVNASVESVFLATSPAGSAPTSRAVFAGGNEVTEDQQLIGWAACVYSDGAWVARGGWNDRPGTGGIKPITDESCAKWATELNDDARIDGIDWIDDADQVRANTKTPAAPSIEDFVLNLHGDVGGGSGLAEAIVYTIVSLVMLVVFGGMALGVIIAKSAGVVMALMALYLLLAGILPSRNTDSKVVRCFKFYVGCSLYAFCLSLILGLIMLVTHFMQEVSGTLGSSIGGMIWVALSPVAAVFLIHSVFKSTGVASPFKPTAALAWGVAAGGIGAGALYGANRLMQRGANLARRATRTTQRPSSSATRSGRNRQQRSEVMTPAPRGRSGRREDKAPVPPPPSPEAAPSDRGETARPTRRDQRKATASKEGAQRRAAAASTSARTRLGRVSSVGRARITKAGAVGLARVAETSGLVTIRGVASYGAYRMGRRAAHHRPSDHTPETNRRIGRFRDEKVTPKRSDVARQATSTRDNGAKVAVPSARKPPRPRGVDGPPKGHTAARSTANRPSPPPPPAQPSQPPKTR